MKFYTVLVAFFFLLMGCQQKNNNSKNEVARVYDFVLTKKELQANLIKTNSVVDSIEAVKKYVRHWAKQKLLYKNALVNLENTDALDALVDKYKEELYINYYKNTLVKKKLDTLVFQQEISDFYTQNKASFRLNETLLKFKYIHINKRNKNASKIVTLFKTISAEDKLKILSNYTGYDDYSFADSVWVSLKDVYLKKAEFPVLTAADLKKTNTLLRKTSTDRSRYYIYINDVLTNNDIAPLSYAKPAIKNILLHKNKLKFFDQMEQILIDDAVKQKKYEVR